MTRPLAGKMDVGRRARWMGLGGLAVALGLSVPATVRAQSAVWLPNGATSGTIYYNNGPVGIGTNAPGGLLDVHGPMWPLFGATLNLYGYDHRGGTNAIVKIENQSSWSNTLLYLKHKADDLSSDAIRVDDKNGVQLLAFKQSGMVGVGVSSPNRHIDVAGGVHSGGAAAELSFGNRGTGSFVVTPANGERWVWYANLGNARLWSGSDKLTVNYSGNVGIGTGSPSSQAALTVDKSNGGLYVKQNESWINYNATGNNFLGGITYFRDTDGNPTNAQISGSGGQPTYFAAAGGNVGIGITNPQAKLAVDGTIKAKDVTVTETPWSDHVFAEGYELMPLAEVGRYIERNGRLPGVPSAAEVAEKGVSIGKTQSKLLEKVEELTLHAIELGRQNERLRQDNLELRQELERRTAQLEERLARLEQR